MLNWVLTRLVTVVFTIFKIYNKPVIIPLSFIQLYKTPFVCLLREFSELPLVALFLLSQFRVVRFPTLTFYF